MSEYLKKFELLQANKYTLHQKQRLNEYKETNEEFIIESKLTGDMVLKKRKYLTKIIVLKKLLKKRNNMYLDYISLRRMYIGSRSSNLKNKLEDIIQKCIQIDNEIKNINVDEDFILTKDVKIEKIPEKSPEKTVKMSPEKKKKIKKYLFETYEQCISQKTSQPTYMSKSDIIAHIKQHDKHLLKHLPTNLQKMKKEDICKVIFS